MSAKPNLFIIGAMKSGTTSLHNYLNTHPRIAMSDLKEPGYFVKELSLHKGEQWYLDLFHDASQYVYRGESSTHYTKLPTYQGVAERLFKFCPNARLLYVMRDPFERTVSHYWHMVRDHEGGGESRAIVDAVKQRPDYLAFSDYATQLRPYIALFGRQAIYTLTFEALSRDPNAEVNRIFEWLELDHHTLPLVEVTTKHNSKPKQMVGVAGVGGSLLNRIQYSQTWDHLSKLVPHAAKDWAKKLAYKEVNPINTEAELAALRSLVGETQHRQVEVLSQLLNRDFPEWSLHANTVWREISPARESPAPVVRALS